MRAGKIFVLLLISITSRSQIDIHTVESTYTSGKYAQAYEELHAEDLEISGKEIGDYYHLSARLCLRLYENDSADKYQYWNEAVLACNSTLFTGDSSQQVTSMNILSYLTISLYNEFSDIINYNPTRTEASERLYLKSYSDETIRHFTSYFNNRNAMSATALYNLGTLFYYEANALISSSSEFKPNEKDTILNRVSLLMQTAYSFIDLACKKNPMYCDLLEGIYYSLENYGPEQ